MTNISSKRLGALALGALALALAANCSLADDGSHRIDVTAPNDLGVTMLQTDRVLDHGNNVFTLRAFSADDQELASLRLTTGVIPDLPQILPGDDFGSEIVISVAGNDDTRIVTRETQLFHVQPTKIQAAFLEIPAISATLGAAKILVTPTTGPEASYYMTSCSSSDLLTSPVAQQCCSSYGPSSLGVFYAFVRPVDGFAIMRWKNTNLPAGCKAANGIDNCSGSNCNFGPQGFARASAIGPNGKTMKIVNSGPPSTQSSYCYYEYDTPPITPIYSNVTGTSGTACGCACDNSGKTCYDATKPGTCGTAPNCATLGCPAGNAGAAGNWNY